ncbi:phage structural protein [uncultured Megasphaera sp.]|uniref:phage structural protein n=1 Tax=uncultured Megasphaera sp. TaxID=165188 RepID=UPI00266EEA77|nr:phage protein [uncultured Megasphaera sp.]
MSDVLTYDPKKNIIIYGGRQLTGFAEDDMITINPLGDGMQIYSGADGEVGRSVDPNRTFEVKVSLAISSKSNDYLSECYNKDRRTGSYMLPLTIKDLSGSTLFFAKQAWVQNFPESKRGRKIDNQDWTFNTGQVNDPVIGGND